MTMHQVMLTAEFVTNYATLDPSATGTGYTLSGGNLTLTGNSAAAGSQFSRSTLSKSSGKWYWEVTVNNLSSSIKIGLCNGSAVYSTDDPINSANALAYRNTGLYQYNSTNYGSNSSYASTNVIGVALDVGGQTVTFYKNNVAQSAWSIGALIGSGPYYFCMGEGGTSDAVTINFGATALTYTPPAGYNAGLYQ